MAASAPMRFARPPIAAVGFAVLALAALAGCVLAGGAAWRAWLGAAFLLLSAPVGATALLMTMRLVPGAWARRTTPALRALADLIPVAAAALAPALVAVASTWPWFGKPQQTAFRTVWFTPEFFLGRQALWLAAVWGLKVALERRPASRGLACIGLMLLLVLGTFAAADLVQSLTPRFGSSGFGLYVIGLQILTAFAAALALALRHGAERPGVLGGVLLTLLLIWAYLDYMPYFISWSGNGPHGAQWYLPRGRGVWAALLCVTVATRAAPAFLLLFSHVRNHAVRVRTLAAVVLAGSAPEIAWLVLPAAPDAAGAGPASGVVYTLAAIGLAGLGAVLARRQVEASE